MDEYHYKRLEALWTNERRLERAWQFAAWREDWTEAASIRTEYNIIFQELITLCRLLGIIGEINGTLYL